VSFTNSQEEFLELNRPEETVDELGAEMLTGQGDWPFFLSEVKFVVGGTGEIDDRMRSYCWSLAAKLLLRRERAEFQRERAEPDYDYDLHLHQKTHLHRYEVPGTAQLVVADDRQESRLQGPLQPLQKARRFQNLHHPSEK